MLKRLRGIGLVLILCLAAAFSGCKLPSKDAEKTQYQATFLELFNTVTTIVGRAETEEDFRAKAQEIHDELMVYHQLFDVYNDYEGINNIKTVNDHAGKSPVKVDDRIIELLLDCREFYENTDRHVNAAMGSVLSLWHEARNDGINDPLNAKLPAEKQLKEAALHIDMESLVIDEEASTVYLSDPDMLLDVGAVAKGWAVQRAAETFAEKYTEGYLISVGGNVCATGPKDHNDTPWVIGIQNPQDPDSYVHTVYLTKGCVVTSGDYQRTYAVDGKMYHHIIDPDTLYPSSYWRSVTVICEDSGAADALSTALFLMDQESGEHLLEQYGAMAMWVDVDGNVYYSPGFEDLIRT